MLKIDLEQITLGLDIVENSRNPMIIIDEDFNIVDSNSSAKNNLLVENEQNIFELFEHILKDEKDMWIDMIEEDFMSLNGVELFTKHNEARYVYQIDIVSLDNSKSAFVFNEITDIAKLAKKAEKLEHIMDRYILFTRSDLDGIITDVSEAYSKLSGYTKAELIGQPHSILKHPSQNQSLFQDLWSVIKQRKVWEGRLKNKKKDGTLFEVDIVIKPEINYNNKHYGYISIESLVSR